MLLNQIISSLPLTIPTLTQLAATIEKHPTYLRNSWWMTPLTLRRLAAAINQPRPNLQSLREHPLLAAHLTTLTTLQLIANYDGALRCTHHLPTWLNDNPKAQVEQIIRALNDPSWHEHAKQWQCHTQLDSPYHAYLLQQLTRYQSAATHAEHEPMRLMPDANQWRLLLPVTLAAIDRFQLIQCTDPLTNSLRSLTPHTLTAAQQRGYQTAQLITFINEAQAAKLTRKQTAQLTKWANEHKRFTLQPVHLLSTQHADDLDRLYQNRRLRARTHTRISPRHAIVSETMPQPLRRWLDKQAIPTQIRPPSDPQPYTQAATNDPNAYLALCVLQQLQWSIGHTQPGLQQTLDNHANALEPTVQLDCQQHAQLLIQQLKQQHQLAGASQHAPHSQPAELQAQLNHAIEHADSIVIQYQGLNDAAPHWREVDPHWIEMRDELAYLHAFCRRAQDKRTFRLDRIYAMHPINQALDPLDQYDAPQRPTQVSAEHLDDMLALRAESIEADAVR